jgi:hypothetical protein
MKSNIQFCDLSLPADSENLIWQKAKEVIQRNAYVLGEEVHTFENEFAEYCDATDCIGVATGCDALLWTMEALEIGKGDEELYSRLFGLVPLRYWWIAIRSLNKLIRRLLHQRLRAKLLRL